MYITRRYDAFMRWHKPLRTGSVFVVFVSICLFLDAEYAGLVPVTLVALGLLVLSRRRFLRGYPRASFLDEAFEKADAELLNGATQRFRPCGRLKIAVCAGRGFEKDDDVYAVATFRRPLLDEPVVEKPRPRSGSASPRIAEALSVDTSLDALLDDAQAMPTPGAAQGTKARGDSIMLDDAPLPVRRRYVDVGATGNFTVASDGSTRVPLAYQPWEARMPHVPYTKLQAFERPKAPRGGGGDEC